MDKLFREILKENICLVQYSNLWHFDPAHGDIADFPAFGLTYAGLYVIDINLWGTKQQWPECVHPRDWACNCFAYNPAQPMPHKKSSQAGSTTQWFAYLLPDPAALGLILSIPEFISEEKIIELAEVNQWHTGLRKVAWKCWSNPSSTG